MTAPSRIVLATGNAGKVREIQAVLAASNITIVPQSEFATPEADETGTTFVENAIIKARNAAAHTGLPAIADDSGLVVDALNGAPGVYSSRFAGANSNDAENNSLLLEKMQNVAEGSRTAHFECVIAYMRHASDPTPIVAHGTWEGRILYEAMGENGFGYDPLFFVPEQGCSSAQLRPEIKNRISHRGQAIQQFVTLFNGVYL